MKLGITIIGLLFISLTALANDSVDRADYKCKEVVWENGVAGEPVIVGYISVINYKSRMANIDVRAKQACEILIGRKDRSGTSELSYSISAAKLK